MCNFDACGSPAKGVSQQQHPETLYTWESGTQNGVRYSGKEGSQLNYKDLGDFSNRGPGLAFGSVTRLVDTRPAICPHIEGKRIMKARRISTWPTVLGLSLAIGLAGCGHISETTTPDKTQPGSVQGSADLLRSGLTEYFDYVQNQHISTDNRQNIEGSTLDFMAWRYGDQSVEYANALAVLTASAITQPRQPSADDISAYFGTVVQQADVALARASNPADYLRRLRTLETEVLDSGEPSSEQVTALSYLVVLEETTGHVFQLQDADKFSWKCAASVVGGAILGGFTGAGGGSVIPVIGTGVGGAIGVVAGGLLGWASGC